MQGILSASVLSIVPLIRPYQWQSLLMPVCFFLVNDIFQLAFTGSYISRSLDYCCLFNCTLGHCFSLTVCMNFQVLPNDMLDFLDAPVPYIVSFLILDFCLLLIAWNGMYLKSIYYIHRFRKGILVEIVVLL